MARKIKRPDTPENILLSGIKTGGGRRRRRLSEDERETLIRMLAFKAAPERCDIADLAPQGSYLARLLRHFNDTDISYSLPLMKLIMITASWLTQRGAYLEVPGLGKIIPTLWTVGLADSGESKTLASEEVMRIVSLDGEQPVNLLPTGSSDAQWIEDLAANNGSYWFQDEVGKFFNKVYHHTTYQRIKPWILDAYSYKPISNRLKGERHKRVIERPMFTFYGLSVFSTWKMDIDLTSMLDGFCQRMNYFIATRRTDADMFDHYLYFTGPEVEERRRELFELWQALCAQENAAGPYQLNPHVIPFLQDWWSGLRRSWGDSQLPKSFVRRIGFSIMRYLPTLHFLLGKSRYPIDLETAELATRFAEYHLESALALLQDYDEKTTGHVQKVVALRGQLMKEGKDATPRNITRRLSTSQRANLPTDLVREILEVLAKIEDVPGLIDAGMEPKEKSNALIGRLDTVRDRLKVNERKRNERRLRDLRRAYLSNKRGGAAPGTSGDGDVVSLEERRDMSRRRAAG